MGSAERVEARATTAGMGMNLTRPTVHDTSTATLRLVMERLTEQLIALVERGHFRGSLTVHIGRTTPPSAELRVLTGSEDDWDLGLD